MLNRIDEIVSEFSNTLENFKIQTVIAVPSRSHQMKYTEHQTMYGIVKRFSFYNNSTNDYYAVTCNLKNDFFSISDLNFDLRKTTIDLNGLKFNNFKENIFKGNCEEANLIFTELKNKFYDNYIKMPVPPMR